MKLNIKKKNLFFKKLVISYSIIFLSIMLIVMIIFYFYIKYSGIKLANINQQELSSQTLKLTENYLDEMNNIAYQIMTESRIINKFSKLQQDNDDQNYLKNILEDIEMSNILSNINAMSKSVWRICLYNQYGDFTYSGAEANMEISKNHLKSINITENMINLRTSKNKPTINIDEKDMWSNYSNSKYIILRRPIMNIYSNEVYGIVEIQGDIRILNQMIQFEEFKNMNTRISDENENDILNSYENKSDIYEDVYETEAFSEKYKLKVQLSQRYKDIFHQYSNIVYSFILAGVLWIIIMLASIAIVAKRIANPLVELTRNIKNTSIANITNINDIDNNIDENIDEIKQLKNAFNSMINKLKESVKQEQQAMLYALQSQMEPHFLYNSLSVISAVGMEDGSEKVPVLCNNLSVMLRYVSTFDDKPVTIKDEIEYLKNYLQLMKERYDEYFSYTINVDHKVQNIKIPKLIIQPIVENCFKHGFSNIEPPYHIDIDIYCHDKNCFVKVSDNGIGISNDIKDRIYKNIEIKTSKIDTNISGMQLGGLGLINSIMRLKLFFSKNIECKIEDNNPSGTIIILKGELFFND